MVWKQAGLTAPHQDLQEQSVVLQKFAPDVLWPVASTVLEQFGWAWREECKGLEAALTRPLELRSPFCIVLCVTTFKRTHQLKLALPLNLLRTLAKMGSCFWLIADFNSEDDVQDHMAKLNPLVQCRHINYVRSQPA